MKSAFKMYLNNFLFYLKFRKKINPHELYTVYDKWQCFILSAVGLWPYQSRSSKRVFYGCFLVSSLSIMVAMIFGITDTWSTDPMIIFESTLAVMYVGIALIACTILYIQEDKVKLLLEKSANDWTEITDKEELKILTAFHQQGLMVNLTLAFYSVPAFLAFGTITFLPELINLTNYSSVFPYYYSRMVIIESAHVYQVVVHSIISFVYSSVGFLAISSTFVNAVKHVCAIYVIVSYKLTNADKPIRKIALLQLKKNKIIISKLIGALNKHTEAIHRVYLIEDIFSKGFLIMEILAAFALALVMVDVVNIKRNSILLFRAFFILGTFGYYIFHLNQAAEQVIQVSSGISTSAYFVEWFTMPMEARQLLRMIIMRSHKNDKLTAGSMSTLSNASFALFIKTCWTIATLLISSQEHLRRKYS